MNSESSYRPSEAEVNEAKASMSPIGEKLSRERGTLMQGQSDGKWSRHDLNVHPSPDALLAYKSLQVTVPTESTGQFEARGTLNGQEVVMRWHELLLRGKVRAQRKEIEVSGTKLTGADVENYWAKYGDGARLLAYENFEAQEKGVA